MKNVILTMISVATFAFTAQALATGPAQEQNPEQQTGQVQVPGLYERPTTICPMHYMPTSCSVVFNGQEFNAEGSNRCFASAKIIDQIALANEGAYLVGVQDLGNMECAPNMPF